MRLGLNVNELVDYKFDYFICQSDFAGDCALTDDGRGDKLKTEKVKRVSQFARLYRFIELVFYLFLIRLFIFHFDFVVLLSTWLFYDFNISLERARGKMPYKPKVITFL